MAYSESCSVATKTTSWVPAAPEVVLTPALIVTFVSTRGWAYTLPSTATENCFPKVFVLTLAGVRTFSLVFAPVPAIS
jgi:hypothetical protein